MQDSSRLSWSSLRSTVPDRNWLILGWRTPLRRDRSDWVVRVFAHHLAEQVTTSRHSTSIALYTIDRAAYQLIGSYEAAVAVTTASTTSSTSSDWRPADVAGRRFRQVGAPLSRGTGSMRRHPRAEAAFDGSQAVVFAHAAQGSGSHQ